MPLIEDREALFLAMLLHDTGKGGVGGQEVAGARAARQACERLGLERRRIELVAWLVEHHLVMSDYAQKRDVADPATVAAFAGMVETPERLRMLLVLTVADIRAVGPGVWNGWKGQLLRELYGATEAMLPRRPHLRRGRRGAPPPGGARLRRPHRPGSTTMPEARAWASAMEDAYFVAFSAARARRPRRLWRARARDQGGAAAKAEIRADRNAAEIVVAAARPAGPVRRPRPGDLPAGGNVVGARIFTSTAGEALDVFFVQDAAGAAVRRRQPPGAGPPGRGPGAGRPRRADVRAEPAAQRPGRRPSPFAIAPS